MLSCDEALELISARLDGPLTQEETARLEEHLSACPACRTLAEDLKELHEELPHLAAQPPAGLKEGVMGQIHTSKVTPFQSKKRQWRWRSLASLAAVAQFRGLRFAQFFFAADNLDAPAWDARGLPHLGRSVGDQCFAAAVEAGRRLLALP